MEVAPPNTFFSFPSSSSAVKSRLTVDSEISSISASSATVTAFLSLTMLKID